MDQIITGQIMSLSVALGIGLLVGAERERRKYLGNSKISAGIRSFTLVALTGAVAGLISNAWVLPAALLAIAILIAISYLSASGEGKGLTTESALVLTFLLGALANFEIDLAAGLGVVLSALLASRAWLHQFVKKIMSERELHDVIIFFAVLLVVMPITPDRYFGPFNAFNLHEISKFVVIVIGISAMGYILKRVLGHRGGLAMAGFLGGFVSSTTVVMKMGQLSKTSPRLTQHAISSALFSNISTLIQLQIILVVTTRLFESQLLLPLIYGLVTAFLLPLFYLTKIKADHQIESNEIQGSAFDLKSSIGFTILVTGLNFASSALYAWLGSAGVLMTSALAGFTDAHANISSVASIFNKGDISSRQVELAVLFAYTSNTISKIIVSFTFGNEIFKLHLISAMTAVLGIIWSGYVFQTQ
jgi:uncharacterized membrane protein (DUF4010 family)